MPYPKSCQPQTFPTSADNVVQMHEETCALLGPAAGFGVCLVQPHQLTNYRRTKNLYASELAQVLLVKILLHRLQQSICIEHHYKAVQ